MVGKVVGDGSNASRAPGFRQIHHARERPTFRKSDDCFEISQMILRDGRAVGRIEFRPACESRREAASRDPERTPRPILTFEQAKAGSLQHLFVEPRRDELRDAVQCASLQLVARRGSRDDSGIGEQEPASGREDTRDFAKNGSAILKMQDDVDRQHGVECARRERQWCIQVGHAQTNDGSEPEGRGTRAR